MEVYDAEDRLATILDFDELADRPEKVAEMLSTRRLDAREDAHGRPRVAASLAIALVALAASAVPARAAYAPKLKVSVTPNAVGVPATFSSTVTQAASETPSKKVVVQLPPEMGPNLEGQPVVCTNAQEQARACPAATQIGNAKAHAVANGVVPVDLSGTVNYGEPAGGALKIVIFLDSKGPFPPAQHITVEGFIRSTPQGLQTTLDNLPTNATVTSFTLAFLGGSKSLLSTPGECGTFPISAGFTSAKNEQTKSTDHFTISGCPNLPPEIDAIRLVPTRFKRPAKAVLRVRVDEAGKIVVRIKRKGKTVRLKRFTSKVGLNKLKPFAAKMKAGRYTLYAKALDDQNAASDVESMPLRVLSTKKKKAKK